jgi:rhodanese-related sulfurtransferase
MRTLLAYIVLLSQLSCSAQSATVNVGDFDKAISSGKVQLLDVRTAQEFQGGYIKNALQANWNDRSQFNDRTQHLDPEKPVYVYCASGVRSAAAAEYLRGKGFKAVNLSGGIIAWRKAGKPVEASNDQGKMSRDDYMRMAGQKGLVLVDFGAPWCPPCRKMEPVVAELKKNPDITVGYVDGGSNTELMEWQKVEAMPTFILYKDGKEVWRKQGIVSALEFEQIIKANA